MMKLKTSDYQNSYLTFKLGKEEFAANVKNVLNILEYTRITEVPKAPEYMKGVINLRGEVLPVIDTRIKFGMSPAEIDSNTCIIVTEIQMDKEEVRIGALVDSVQQVLEIEENQIEPCPTIGNQYNSEFISGMVVDNDKFIMILNINKVFSQEEIEDVQSSSSLNYDNTEELSM